MTESLVFDSGPVISLSTVNLLWLLEPLKKKFAGEFYIPKGVYDELIDRPLQTKKYKFEALQILPMINSGVLRVIDNDLIQSKAAYLVELANNIFKARGNWISIVHHTDMEVVATAIHLGSSTIVVDERTTRVLIEDPRKVAERLMKKLHTRVEMNQENLAKFKKEVGKLRVIRSVELCVIAYELGLLDKYMFEDEEKTVPEPRRTLLEGVLWGIKLNGCSLGREELEDIVKLET